jgi:predicted O-methyltransferase YrrM
MTSTYRVIQVDGQVTDVNTKEEAIKVAYANFRNNGLGSEIWVIEDNTDTLVTWLPFTTVTA